MGMFINPAWIVHRDAEEKRNLIKTTKFIFTYFIMQEMCLLNRWKSPSWLQRSAEHSLSNLALAK